MKTYLYLSTAIISVSLAAGGEAWAQCVSTQDCATLGYTETSCPNGGVKCPFGNKWFCSSSEITPEQCTELGFTQTCAGTGYSGGASLACNGKYNYCTCTDGYTWNTTNQICEYDYKTNCVIGALYYSDGTCSQEKLSSKTLLGVVIYEKSASQSGWIMAIQAVRPIYTGIAWDTGSYYSTGITDKAVSASCTNTQKLIALGSRFEAAIKANNYKPNGTPSDKSWCLPSYDLLNNLNNSVNFAKVNAGITIAKGKTLGWIDDGFELIWSSSEYNDSEVWEFTTRDGSFSMQHTRKNTKGTTAYDGSVIRPVMEF